MKEDALGKESIREGIGVRAQSMEGLGSLCCHAALGQRD
jgi:hypothetical protein